MQRANENGVYEAETVEELARCGRAHASIELCQCEDGLYRYALDMAYGHGGFAGPIIAKARGFESLSAAKESATHAAFPEGVGKRPAERTRRAARTAGDDRGEVPPAVPVLGVALSAFLADRKCIVRYAPCRTAAAGFDAQGERRRARNAKRVGDGF